MKGSHSRRNRSAGKDSVAVADDLIRQVSESVVARSTGRRARGQIAVPPAPTLVRAPEPPAPPMPPAPPVPAEPVRYEAPVLKAPEAPVQPAPPKNDPPAVQRPPKAAEESGRQKKPALAIFCYLEPECAIGKYIEQIAPLLAERGIAVHIFSRHPFKNFSAGIKVHELGLCDGPDILASTSEYTLRALSAFLTEFSAESAHVSLLGFEWSSVRALLELSRTKRPAVLLSLHSLECQRSDLSSEMSRKIQELEIEGLRIATSILTHDSAAAEAALKRVPDCKARLAPATQRFAIEDFSSGLDAGAVKARFNVGPIDPTILYVGNFDDRHGPELLMKAVPAIVKNHPQARFIFIGDGPAMWPMRVHARYLLLEHVVRFPGHLSGKALHELIEAADVICVPSRERTGDWIIHAAWAAKRPVLTTHAMGQDLKHEENAVLVYPNEGSVVWGVERILFDEGLRKKLAANGHQKLLENSGWGRTAAQIADLMGVNK